MSVTFVFWPLLHRTPYGVSGISFIILSYLCSYWRGPRLPKKVTDTLNAPRNSLFIQGM